MTQPAGARSLWDQGSPHGPPGFDTWGQSISDALDARNVERTIQARKQTIGDWPERVISTEDSACSATALTFEHGRVVFRGSGSGSAARSNRRSFFMIPGSPGGHSRIRSILSGTDQNVVTANNVPQRGHAHGVQQSGGLWTAAVVWHDIAFNSPGVLNVGIWRQETSPGAVGAVFQAANLVDQAAVSAAQRVSNVVTLTVPTGHGFVKGDVVTTDLANNSYDGTFTLSSVTATTVVYTQAGTDLSTSTGTVTLLRTTQLAKIDVLFKSTAVSAGSRTSNVVTVTVPAGHGWQKGDLINADLATASYDGTFTIKDLPSSTQLRWDQVAADDASSGAGTVSSTFPYVLESEWWPGYLRARVYRLDTMQPRSVPPPWDGYHAVSCTLGGLPIAEPDPLQGQGCGIIAAHPSGPSATVVTQGEYSDITTAPLGTGFGS
jgi:hypothetical protein